MARRKRPIDVSETIFNPVQRIEHYRRVVTYLQAHRALLVAGGAGKRELATLDATAKDMADIVALCEIFPPDTPPVEPESPREEQPLLMPGAEAAVAEIFAIALGDEA